MARVVRTEEEHHLLRIRDDRGTGHGELLLVAGRQRAYLWIGSEGLPAVMLVSGPATLRRLAREILKEVPAPRKRSR